MADNADILLTALGNAFAKNGANLPVTLLIHGAIVSGTFITAEEYVTRAGVDAYKALGSPQKPTPEDLSETLGLILSDDLRSVTGAAERGRQIYLRDVTILSSSGSQLSVPTWRGLASDVNGWNFGALATTDDEEPGSALSK